MTATAARPGFSILVCPDGQLLRAHLTRLLDAFPPQSGQWERHVYWGDEEPPPRFWEQLVLQGLFDAPKAVIVRQAHLWPAAIWKKISHALARRLDGVWPFFCMESVWEKGKPKLQNHITKLRCMDFADQQGWIWRHEGLNEHSVKKYVLQRAQALGLRFEPDALEQFCSTIPPDSQSVENELKKLVLLQNSIKDSDSTATQSHAASVTLPMTTTASWSPECNVFACIRHMEAGNLAAVWKELARGRNDDNGLLFPFLALLARELRVLWQILAEENVRLHPNEAGFKRQVAARLGSNGIARGMALLVDAELNVKSGRHTPEQSLDLLAVEITHLFQARH